MSLDPAALPGLFGYGFALGWSVAWPPGPINAEIARRVLAQGFWPGVSLCLGACAGDALWAVGVAIGAGVFFTLPAAHLGLGLLSTLLLLVMAGMFLRGAWHGVAVWRGLAEPTAPGRFESGRGGLVLGLTLALTSPWNVAFWLAVIGRPESAELGLAASFVVVAAVILGAASWGVVFGLAVLALGRSFAGAPWEVFAKATTALLMLYFAGRSIQHLAFG
ncbi:MAG: LysE family transporter [Proteobacteria bacterium]|nr:LysE family transporter [Pseudomonadota bacterium]MBI3507977.1 LysE family transporter [Pseudomonadota bacterium]